MIEVWQFDKKNVWEMKSESNWAESIQLNTFDIKFPVHVFLSF